ncbi:MAG: DDE-type integrase/transposase/recombinase [Xanthomonadales bacterium]|nr:DDE-type integrase/transposase/recombinase [Xanthomonadales bacterium]MDH4019514.1 DDE-type integrase/transposase/recombinase [Xanthomonadales bacterium]
MARKRYTSETIIRKLREAEILQGQGLAIVQAVKKLGVTGSTIRRTRDGRTLKLMVVMDEFTRRCLAVHVARRIRSKEALEVFADLMSRHGVPEHVRSDNGPQLAESSPKHRL